MTKEEAIVCLKGIKDYGRDTFTEQSDWQNSLDMAIKALEQQPSNDCERVLNRVMEYTYGMLTTEKIGLQHLIKSMIDELPPVTPTFTKGISNGDMIKAIFPFVEVKEKNNGYEVYFGFGTATQYFNHQWWNAPYKSNCIPSEYDLSEDIELSNPQMYR